MIQEFDVGLNVQRGVKLPSAIGIVFGFPLNLPLELNFGWTLLLN